MTPIVTTAAGRLEGVRDAGVLAFKGVPYATAARFAAPRPPAPWSGVRAATGFGPPAPQILYPFFDPSKAGDRSWDEARDFHRGAVIDEGAMSEDCLRLNVWTPATTGRRPVMVWCHGGGFTHGTGAWSWWTGENLARDHDVVVVTLNHRLNVFGFVDLTTIAPDEGFVANAGMRDIVAALEWVRDNIAAFGGDPGNVTIFGQSGGGGKVGTLMAMPSARGFFHKAIIQSGAQVLRAIPRERARRMAERVLAALGLTAGEAGRIRDATLEQLLRAFAAADESATPGAPRGFGPAIDPDTLPADPFDPAAPALSRDVSLLIGATAEEITSLQGFREKRVFAMPEADLAPLVRSFGALDPDQAARVIAAYRMSRPEASPAQLFVAILSDRRFGFPAALEAERKTAAGGAPAFLYRLAWQAPVMGGRYGAPHNLCLPLIFGRDRAPGITGDGATRHHRLAARMQAAWVAFARTGSPDHPDLPAWPAYDAARRATMILDDECRIELDPRAGERAAQASLPIMV